MDKEVFLSPKQKEELILAYKDVGDMWKVCEEDAYKFYYNGVALANRRLGAMLRNVKVNFDKIRYTDDIYRKAMPQTNIRGKGRPYKVYWMEDEADFILASNRHDFLTVKMFNKSDYPFILIHNDIQKLLDFTYSHYKHPRVTAGFWVDTSRLHIPYFHAHAYGRAIEITHNDSIPIGKDFYKAYRDAGIRLVLYQRGRYSTIWRGVETKTKVGFRKNFNADRRIQSNSIVDAFDKPYTWSKRGSVF